MKLPRRNFLHLVACVGALPAVSRIARAQTYPSRPITIVAPFPAGGATDIVSRTLAEGMKAPLGQTILVENVTGASGTIGSGRVVRAEPDGYTLLIGQWSSHVGAGALYRLPYHVLHDFEPISVLTTSPLWILGKNDLPAKDLKELIAWLKANPDKASVATVVTVGPKRLELLHEVVPTMTIVGLLVNPTSPNLVEADVKEQRAAAQTLGLELHVLNASTERDFDSIFATLPQLRAGGLVIGTDSFFNTQKEHLAALSVRHRVPTVHQYREFARAGGLMSYGTDTSDLSRQVGVYTGRILKGDKPAELPVQQASKVEMVVNLKAAKMMGLTVPLPLLARAD